MEDDFIADEIINSQQRNKKGILMECRICSKKVNGDLDLLSHFKNKHPEEKPYKCDHCDYKSKILYDVKIHKKRIHCFEIDTKKYICSFCKNNFLFYSELKRHEKIHFKINNFKCDICLNFYTSEIILRNHKTSFHTKKDSPCLICSQECTDHYTLTQHYKHIHPKNDLICEYCGEIFTKKYNATRHKNRCIKSFTCKDCGQIFKYKYTLKFHNNNCLGNKNNNHLDMKNIEANSPSHTENPNQEISHLSTSFEENDPPQYDTAFNPNFPPALYTQTHSSHRNDPPPYDTAFNPNFPLSLHTHTQGTNDPNKKDPPPYPTAFNPNFPPSLYTQSQEKEEIGNILEDLLDLENCLREKST